MAWRGRTNILERFYSCLPYLLPMSAATLLGGLLFAQIPGLSYSYILFILLNGILAFGIVPPLLNLRIIVWFALFFLVVRNDRIKHFIRFNTMQALMIDICITLVIVVLQLLAQIMGGLPFFDKFIEAIFTATFLAVNAAFIYSIFQIVRGLYPEMPMVSDISYHYTRY